MKKYSIVIYFLWYAFTGQTVKAQNSLEAKIISAQNVQHEALKKRYENYKLISFDFRTLNTELKKGLTKYQLRIDNLLDDEVKIEVRDYRSPGYKLYQQENGSIREVGSKYKPQTYIIRNLQNEEIGRMNVNDKKMEARIVKAGETYLIKMLNEVMPDGNNDLMVLVRANDVMESQGELCGTQESSKQRKMLKPSISGNTSLMAPENCLQLEIAGAGDYSLFQEHGLSSAESRVFEVINMAEPIYDLYFGIHFTVTGNVVSTSPDPYTSEDSGTLLDQFKSNWNNLNVPIKRDIALLISGKNFDGGTKGRAFVGVAGYPESAYGIIQSETDEMAYMVAHEIGHSFNADHDEDGCAHLLSSNRYIMCAWVGSSFFSAVSTNAINDYVQSHISLFISEYTLSTNASASHVDGNLTYGELHAGNTIATRDYFLEDNSNDVVLKARNRITLEPSTRIKNGAKFRAQIIPDLSCTQEGLISKATNTGFALDLKENNLNPGDIYVYPNPSSGVFTVSTGHTDCAVMEVYSPLGNRINKMKLNANSNYQVDLSDRPKGIYLLNIMENNRLSKKMVVVQ